MFETNFVSSFDRLVLVLALHFAETRRPAAHASLATRSGREQVDRTNVVDLLYNLSGSLIENNPFP
jgi:hypothetical protein